MLLEMHCHTSEHSLCSSVKAVDLITQVYHKGLQGAVLTDHHFLWSDHELQALKKAAQMPDHFLILSGQEVHTADMGDVLVYGAEEIISRGTRVAAIRAKHPHAALVLAHAYRKGGQPTPETLLGSLFDGIEIFSSNHSTTENTRGLRDWHRYRFTALAGTDTHGMSYAALYPTLFDHPIENIQDLAEEIRKGRCRPFFKEIPKAGANAQVDEIVIGAKGGIETRERIIIRKFRDVAKWLPAERAFYITEEIARHGFDRGKYRVPRLVEEDKENMILIEQGLRGSSFFEKVIRSNKRDARYFVRLSAQWLSGLHNLGLQVTPAEEFLEREPPRLARYLDRFDEIGHRHAGRFREIAETVHLAEVALFGGHPEQLVQSHGDYHPKNIYIGQDNLNRRETLYVAAIDFGSSYCLPPAYDVGTFLAQFRNQFADYQEILRQIPESVFLDAYLSTSKGVVKDFMAQVELFRARTNLSIASYLVKLGLGDSENLWRVLVEAENALTLFETAR